MKQKVRWIAYLLAATLVTAAAFLPGAGQPALAEDASFDLEVTVSVPQHMAPDATYLANIAVNNLGEVASPAETTLVVTLPAGVTFISASDQTDAPLPPDSIAGSQLTWNLGSLPAGACTRHVWLSLKTAANLAEGTALTVQASVTPTSEDTAPDNNTASDTSLVCDMAGSSKQVNTNVARPGDVLTYTIQLRLAQRSGMSAVQQRSVTLTDTLPAGHQVRFLGWNGPVSGDWDGHTLRWQGQVRAGEPLTLQYRVGVEGDITPGTVITNGAHLSWGPMQEQLHLQPVETRVELPGNAAMVGRQGQAWQPAAGLAVTVPPEAVQATTRFEYQALFNNARPETTPPGLIFANRAFALNAFQFGELHQFGQPITLTLQLSQQEAAGLKHESLQLWYRNSAGEPWARLGAQVWVSDDTLQVTTNHFTQFALFGEGAYWSMLPVIRR